jgi:hypothetical protein
MIAGNQAHRIRRSPDIIAINEDAAGGTNQIATACGAKLFRELWKGQIAQKIPCEAEARPNQSYK